MEQVEQMWQPLSPELAQELQTLVQANRAQILVLPNGQAMLLLPLIVLQDHPLLEALGLKAHRLQ